MNLVYGDDFYMFNIFFRCKWLLDVELIFYKYIYFCSLNVILNGLNLSLEIKL